VIEIDSGDRGRVSSITEPTLAEAESPTDGLCQSRFDDGPVKVGYAVPRARHDECPRTRRMPSDGEMRQIDAQRAKSGTDLNPLPITWVFENQGRCSGGMIVTGPSSSARCNVGEAKKWKGRSSKPTNRINGGGMSHTFCILKVPVR